MIHPYGNLLEESILAASSMELTELLFERLVGEIRNARTSLRARDIASRSVSTGKAIEIVLELSNSLDDARGGELSRNLRRLYAYVVDQLNAGNTSQDDLGYANAEAVAVPLAEAWKQIAGSAEKGSPADGALPYWSTDGGLACGLSFSG